MTEYTIRLILIVRASVRSNANQASKLVDKIGGEHTFNVPLARVSNPTVPFAYVCNWAMTKQKVKALRDKLLERGFTNAELKEAIKEGYIVDPNKKATIFIADNWLPGQDKTNVWSLEEILSKFNLQTIEV